MITTIFVNLFLSNYELKYNFTELTSYNFNNNLNNYSNVTDSVCFTNCNNNIQCKGVVYNNNNCFLISNIKNLINSSNYQSYERIITCENNCESYKYFPHYLHGRCHCDIHCLDFNDCCDDYETYCITTLTTTPTTTLTTTLTTNTNPINPNVSEIGEIYIFLIIFGSLFLFCMVPLLKIFCKNRPQVSPDHQDIEGRVFQNQHYETSGRQGTIINTNYETIKNIYNNLNLEKNQEKAQNINYNTLKKRGNSIASYAEVH